MTQALSANVELLVSAHLFCVDPARARERVERAIESEVTGLLYNQLRDACRNALKAPKSDLPLACSAIGDLITAIGTVPPQGNTKQSDARLPHAD